MQRKQQGGDIVVSELLATPPRKVILNIADMSGSVLTLMDALDIAEVSGFSTDDFAAVMRRGTTRDKAKLMYAFAWVVLRRIEPGITYETVLSYQLELVGEPPKPSSKAKTIVAVASLAGISPEAAKQLTVDEVSAITELHQKRIVRRTTPRRRRAV